MGWAEFGVAKQSNRKRGCTMLKTMRCILMIVAIGLIAVNAFAQSAPSGRWWRSPRVVKALNLTGGEIEQLENAYGESRREMIRLKNKVEKEQFELENMMGRRKLNEAAIRKQNRKLEKARSDLADAKFAFVIDVRRIIGHARFQQLVDMQPSRR
jgi:Spy/CpxP family protein refolding chaperone